MPSTNPAPDNSNDALRKSPEQVFPGSLSRRKIPLGIALIIFGVVVWTFLPSLRNGFIDLDDPSYISENIHVRNGFSWSDVGWAFSNSVGGSWHPLTWFSLMLDGQLYGLRPAGHHLTDVLLHASSAVLLFILLRRITGATWKSALVAALFSLHPLRVESVAWAAERKDTLSTFFFMLTLLAYVRYLELSRERSPSTKHFYLLALALFVCGLMSKPMLVTLPVVLLLLDGWPLGRLRSPLKSSANLSLINEKLPFFALAALIAAATLFTQRDLGAVSELSNFPLVNRLGNASLSYWRYLGQMVWPVRLAVFYPLPLDLDYGRAAVAAFCLLALSVLLLLSIRSKPFLAFGWLWYLITLLPVIGLIQVGQQSHADRYTYIPLIGIFVSLVWLMDRLTGNWSRRWIILAPLGLSVVVACVLLTRHQLGYWRDSERLFRRSLAVTQNNAMAENILGTLLVRQGRLDEGLLHLQRAVNLAPLLPHSHNDLGAALGKKGREDEAFKEFLEALRLKPNFPEAHRNVALALDKQGYPNEALTHLHEAVKLKPEYAPAQRNLGTILGKQGWHNEAIEHLREAIRLSPEDAEAHCNLGITLGKTGHLDEAIAELLKAVALDPSNSEAQCNLGVALGAKGQIQKAINHLQIALKLRPDYPDARMNLNIALEQKVPAVQQPGTRSIP